MRRAWTKRQIDELREILLNNKLDYDEIASWYDVPNDVIRKRFSRYGLTDAYKYSKNIGKSQGCG